MSNSLNETIIKLANLAEADKVVVFTNAFKVFGTLLKDKSKTEKEIVTLFDVTICNYFEDCECGCSCASSNINYEWFNIPEDKVVSFSILPA